MLGAGRYNTIAMKRFRRDILLWAGLAVVIVTGVAVVSGQDDAPAGPAPAATEGEQGGENLDYWLERATPADGGDDTSDDTADGTGAAEAPGEDDSGEVAAPSWALPGVMELSDGTVLAGMMWTAGDEPLAVYVEAEKRWRRVPLAAALSITAVVAAERMEDVWRWRATGSPERIYTGEQYPFRRLEWTITLADGGEIRGVIKGQAVYLAGGDGESNGHVLSERTKGDVGQSLDELVHVRRVVISRRAMEAIPADPAIGSEQSPDVH